MHHKIKKISLVIQICSWSIVSMAQEFTLLHTNDIESVYEPIQAFWNDEIDYIGGIPQLSSMIKWIRADEQTSFLLDAGDIFTGSLCKATGGKLAFDIYNAMGYDAIALGNHEFEYGWKTLADVRQRAQFPVLCANLFYNGTDICFAQEYTILEENGIRIGVIGVIGEDAFLNTIMAKNRLGIQVKEPAPIVQKLVDKLKPEVDMIVVLTHQNKTAPMQTDKEADPEVQRGYDEDYALAGAVKGIDMIIGGHSDHGLWTPVQHPKTGTYIGLTFGQGKYLGYARFKKNRSTGEITLLNGRLLPVDAAALKPDPVVAQLIQKARSDSPHLADTIAYLDRQASRKYYRESNIGNLLADILRSSADADIGMISSGSIRFDLNPGPVTVEQLYNVFPFTDVLATVEVGGRDLKELFEYSYALNYGLIQCSGIEATYNSKKPIGQRLVTLIIGDKLVVDENTYKLATISYAATGGDGLVMLKDKKSELFQRSVAEVFVQYFRKHKEIRVPALGRQRDLAREHKK